MTAPIDRRAFLGATLMGGAAFGLTRIESALSGAPEAGPDPKGAASAAMPTRALGRTGHQVAIFSLGGQALLEQRGAGVREKAVAVIHRALDLGVNYCDTAPLYGPSQDYYGEVMKTRRKETFLATKTDDRSRDGSLRLLEDSLRRLQTDRIDLWQMHHVGSMADLDKGFGKGGAIEAIAKAREEKTVRFAGITGHFDPASLLEGIRRFDFDCILMALNAADPHHLPFQKDLLKTAAEKKMGIIGMKVPARGRLLARSGLKMKDCVDYVWSLPVSTVIIGCDSIEQLEQNVALARDFKPLDESTRAALESRTRQAALACSWYKRGADEPWG
jgi:aryl-alcohol dehydrogenase-like predicted oxidoreductase